MNNDRQVRTQHANHLLAWLVIVGPLLACCGIGLFANWALADYDPFVADDVPPSIIEGNAEIVLPPSAENLQAHQEGFQEIFIQVRFSMAATDLPTFLQHTLCTQPLIPVDPKQQESYPRDPSWWTPMDAQRLHGCHGTRKDFRQHILIDMTDPQAYTVYVSASQQ